MTHDELLEKIDEEGEFLVQHFDSKPRVHSALRAVVELHSPCTGERHDDSIELINAPCVCVHCPDDLWPCETIQTIEKELE